MGSSFEIAIALTLTHEGGFTDNSADPGHATKYGITQADMPGADIATITPQQATLYYLENYWKGLYSSIASQPVANKLFDCGVLFGVGTAVKVLQGVLGIVQDGIFGPASLAALNAADGATVVGSYEAAMLAHANAVVTANPTLSVFLAGWHNRIVS
jgi:lysozyme family protein